MPTNFPGSVDTFSVKVDNVSDVMAADVNNLQDAMVAVQNRIGTTAAPNFVTMTGDQTIGGIKTFSSSPVAPGLNLTSAFGGGNGVYNGNGDAASSTQANLQIRSWFGIGFSPSISGQPVPQNENAVWIDTRTGNLSARGNITSTGGQFVGNGAGLTNVNATNVTGTAGQLGYSVNSTIGFGGRGGPEVTGHGGGAAAMMSFHRPGIFAVNFGLDGNDIAVGGWSFGNVSWRILHQGNWRGIIGAANVGEVGTYALMRGPVSISTGATVAGSSLVFANAAGGTLGSSGAGTWRCMGVTDTPLGDATTTLWLRIS